VPIGSMAWASNTFGDKRINQPPASTLISSLAYLSNLKIEAIFPCETLWKLHGVIYQNASKLIKFLNHRWLQCTSMNFYLQIINIFIHDDINIKMV
jgi:hypothetical protein